jgi:hypothetical protein
MSRHDKAKKIMVPKVDKKKKLVTQGNPKEIFWYWLHSSPLSELTFVFKPLTTSRLVVLALAAEEQPLPETHFSQNYIKDCPQKVHQV